MVSNKSSQNYKIDTIFKNKLNRLNTKNQEDM